MEQQFVYLTLAAAFGLFMAWGIGANDVANAMATSIGSGALTIRKALVVAAVFEFSGAVLAGGEVTSTIRRGIVDSTYVVGEPELLIYGMLAALLAAATWLLVASRMGWPVSTTHSIVGAIVGFAVIALGVNSVEWEQVATIVASWIISPLTAGVIAFRGFQFNSLVDTHSAGSSRSRPALRSDLYLCHDNAHCAGHDYQGPDACGAQTCR